MTEPVIDVYTKEGLKQRYNLDKIGASLIKYEPEISAPTDPEYKWLEEIQYFFGSGVDLKLHNGRKVRVDFTYNKVIKRP